MPCIVRQSLEFLANRFMTNASPWTSIDTSVPVLRLRRSRIALGMAIRPFDEMVALIISTHYTRLAAEGTQLWFCRIIAVLRFMSNSTVLRTASTNFSRRSRISDAIPRWIGWLTAIVFACRLVCAQPLLSKADETFWHEQARRIVDSARLDPGQKSGKWVNSTPYAIHVPGGNMGYPAFWVRDAVMMLGGDFIEPAELEGWIRLMASTIFPQDRPIRPGVLVPAYAVPDHINFDGKPTYYPGNYETGNKQGGGPWGKYPPIDDQFYFVMAVYQHWKMTGDLGLFRSRISTGSSEMQLADLCEKVYRAARSDAQTGLCVAGDVKTENAKDFGFCDAESKSGKLLFPSILKFVAAGELAGLFRATGDAQRERVYKKDAGRLKTALQSTFYHASGGTGEGWLHSATGIGDQPDVWGSAFAIQSGAVAGTAAQPIARALIRAYREKTAVREGCVRQILTTDTKNGGGWEVSKSPVGVYQNGGYWGTASGWYIAAMSLADRDAAESMARDFVGFLRGHQRPDGLPEAWEWFNPDNGRNANPLYAATVALPYLSLAQTGLR